MTFLPILERELLQRARNRANYWGRFGLGVTGVLIAWPTLFWSGASFSPAAVGRGVFTGIFGAAFLLACAACLVTADSISAERREGTLGLLLLTRVRRFDVLVGKFASNGLTCFFALAAVVPVLMLSVLAGGVTGGEVARKGLVLVDSLFLALSAGLWVSARAEERFRSARDALLLVSVLVLVPSFLAALLHWRELDLISPLGALGYASDIGYRQTPGYYWFSLCLVQAVGWGLLLGATVGLRASTDGRALARYQAGQAEGTTPRPRPRAGFVATASEPTALHRLVRRQRGLKLMLWIAASTSFIQYGFYGLFGRFAGLRSAGMALGISSAMTLVLGVINGSLIAWVASRFFVEARRTGELELLLTTPLGRETVISAQWDVFKRLVRWPVVLMLLPIVLQGVAVLALRGAWPGSPWKAFYACSSLLSALNTIAAVGALGWLGFWFGLRAGGQARVILWTVGLTRGLPFLVSMGWYALSSLLAPTLRAPTSTLTWVLTSMMPQLVNLALSVFWFCLARRQLRADLSGAEPSGISLMFSRAFGGPSRIFHRARHWTPG